MCVSLYRISILYNFNSNPLNGVWLKKNNACFSTRKKKMRKSLSACVFYFTAKVGLDRLIHGPTTHKTYGRHRLGTKCVLLIGRPDRVVIITLHLPNQLFFLVECVLLLADVVLWKLLKKITLIWGLQRSRHSIQVLSWFLSQSFI